MAGDLDRFAAVGTLQPPYPERLVAAPEQQAVVARQIGTQVGVPRFSIYDGAAQRMRSLLITR